MITEQEFLVLYEKYLNGQCSPEEKSLLTGYNDRLKLLDDNWTDDLGNQQMIRNSIWQKLSRSRNPEVIKTHKINMYAWMQIAAALILALAAAALFVNLNKKPVDRIALVKSKPILPGGNRAYLTLANGSQIILDDAKNGTLVAKAGINISKQGNGKITYHFTQTATNVAPNQPLKFNTITTPRGGQYQIELEDGTHIWLNAASSIKFPQSFTGPDRELELSGEAYFEVAKNKAKPFIVNANGTRVQVLGTHFNVNAYTDNAKVTTTLLEGSVKFSNGNSEVMLVPGQQGISSRQASAIQVNNADIEEVTAWKNGFFVFHDENIVDIMNQVGRWYDVDVEYMDDMQSVEFGGTISRYKNITELLNNMQLTRTIHYKLEGRRVIIMK